MTSQAVPGRSSNVLGRCQMTQKWVSEDIFSDFLWNHFFSWRWEKTETSIFHPVMNISVLTKNKSFQNRSEIITFQKTPIIGFTVTSWLAKVVTWDVHGPWHAHRWPRYPKNPFFTKSVHATWFLDPREQSDTPGFRNDIRPANPSVRAWDLLTAIGPKTQNGPKWPLFFKKTSFLKNRVFWHFWIDVSKNVMRVIL